MATLREGFLLGKKGCLCRLGSDNYSNLIEMAISKAISPPEATVL